MPPTTATAAPTTTAPTTAALTTAALTTAPTPLRRNWRFQLLWAGSASALLGLEAADVAYPLTVLALTGSPAQAGLFGLVQGAAMLLAGLPAGDVADRFDRRRILIAAESLRALASAGVAVALLLGRLTLPHLLLVAFVLGAAQPFGGTARMLLVRAVVPPEQLTAALTQDEVRAGVAQLAGPPLGGGLYGLGRALPFCFTSVAFAVSLLCALVVRPVGGARPAPRPAPNSTAADGTAADGTAADGTADDRERGPARMLAGIRLLWRDPVLRGAVTLLASLNAVGAPLSLAAVYVLREQGTAAWSTGLALSGGAIGGLAGAALVGPLHRRFRPGVLLLGVTAVEVPLVAALGLPLGPCWVAAVLLCAMLGIPSLSVLVDVLIFRQVPDHKRGRTISAVMTVLGLGIPAGMAVTGLLLAWLGGVGALLALAGALASGVLLCAAGPVLRRTDWPAERPGR
ncbi:MFS transporter [Streptomyces sp. NPDC092296]|uniref:MFS transporter n=1 Tax=Streptomyces sp. NPDC092296 TaxID=3366012 RepID=UPI003821ADDF